MNYHDLVDRLGWLFALARSEEWNEAIPGIETPTLRLGILVQRIRAVRPRFWNDDPEDVATALEQFRPDLVAEIARCDLRSLGFVMRTHRILDDNNSTPKRTR